MTGTIPVFGGGGGGMTGTIPVFGGGGGGMTGTIPVFGGGGGGITGTIPFTGRSIAGLDGPATVVVAAKPVPAIPNTKHNARAKHVTFIILAPPSS
jgi:hypothetical protein